MRRNCLRTLHANEKNKNKRRPNISLSKAITIREDFEQIRKDETLFSGSEKVGFKSFEIIKEIGAGAFGIV